MTLPRALSPEQQEIGARLEPAVAGDERLHLGLGDHRHQLELEAVDGLAVGQVGVGQVPRDAPTAAIGHLGLGEGGEEAGRRPALLVGLLGDTRPHRLHRRQAQLGQQKLDARGVDREGLAHAATSIAHASIADAAPGGLPAPEPGSPAGVSPRAKQDASSS